MYILIKLQITSNVVDYVIQLGKIYKLQFQEVNCNTVTFKTCFV